MPPAIVATLALVSSAQAQTTYTWDGGGGDDSWQTGANWDSNTRPVSSLTLTDIVFAGSTRPDTVYDMGNAFGVHKIEFNTTVDFSISPYQSSTRMKLGAGGIVNQVAQQQTFNNFFDLMTSGTTPVNVVSGGEVVFNDLVAFSAGSGVLEKLGSGTVTFNSNFVSSDSYVRSTAGTTNLTRANASYQIALDVSGGQVNLAPGNGISQATPTFVRGGVFSALGDVDHRLYNGQPGFIMTSGTMILGDQSSNNSGVKISGGTVVYLGTGGDVVFGSEQEDVRPLTIEGGSQDFGILGITNHAYLGGPSTLVTGGTSTGYYNTLGVTNDGGSITFTAVDALLAPASNSGTYIDIYDPVTGDFVETIRLDYGLTFTSGTVSIGTVAGGGTAIGSLVNGSISDPPLNTTLGAGNTLKLDLNEDLTRDLLITSGTMTWGGTLAFNLGNTGALSDSSSWNFFNDPTLGNTGAFAGDLSGITLSASSIYNGLSFSRVGDIWTSTPASTGQQFRFNESSGLLDIVPVPEPSSIVLAGLGLAMLGWRRWRRSLHAAA